MSLLAHASAPLTVPPSGHTSRRSRDRGVARARPHCSHASSCPESQRVRCAGLCRSRFGPRCGRRHPEPAVLPLLPARAKRCAAQGAVIPAVVRQRRTRPLEGRRDTVLLQTATPASLSRENRACRHAIAGRSSPILPLEGLSWITNGTGLLARGRSLAFPKRRFS